MYMVAQCLGAICGVGLVKAFQKSYYNRYGGGANELADGYNKGTGLGAEIIGTFVLVYTVFSATDPKRNARDSHVPVCYLPFFFFRFFRLISLFFFIINLTFVFNNSGFGSPSHRICCVHGSPRHDPHHRNWNQPCQEFRSCCYLQQRQGLG